MKQSSYSADGIQNAIELLQQTLNKNRSEVIEVVKRVLEFYGIAARELVDGDSNDGRGRSFHTRKEKSEVSKTKASSKSRRGPNRTKSRKVKTPVAAKYRNSNGDSWTGRGKTPIWLRDALNSGASLDSFRVSDQN